MIRLTFAVPGPDEAAALVDVLLTAGALDPDHGLLWCELADGIGDGLDALPTPQENP